MKAGKFRFSLRDESRIEVLNGGSTGRDIEVLIYYPIDDDAPDRLEKDISPYLSHKKAMTMNSLIRRGFGKVNVSESYEGIEPAEGTYPVIFFGHGYGGFTEQNSRMCVDLVKAGFTVVSVGHAYDASVIELDGGTVITQNKKVKMCSPFVPALIAQSRILKKRDFEPLLALESLDSFQDKYCSVVISRVSVWADDVLFVLKYLKEHASDDKFILKDRMDFSRGVGTTGHSLGGCVSYYLCMNSPEFACGCNIDGAIFGHYEGYLEKPFMQISCESNINVATRVITHRKADAYRVIVKKMKHIGFSDAKLVLGSSISGKLDLETMESAMFSANREFFNKYLKGVDSDFEYLNRTTSENVIFERYET